MRDKDEPDIGIFVVSEGGGSRGDKTCSTVLVSTAVGMYSSHNYTSFLITQTLVQTCGSNVCVTNWLLIITGSLKP